MHRGNLFGFKLLGGYLDIRRRRNVKLNQHHNGNVRLVVVGELALEHGTPL